MKTWFERPACRQHAACIDCRTSRAFRETIYAKGQVAEVDFACPHGITKESLSNPNGLGSLVEKIAKPIAKLLGINCYGPDGRLKPESACANRREKLNALSARRKAVTT